MSNTVLFDKDIAKETAQLLLSISAITLSPQKPYRFTTGLLSPIYCDNRMVISYPDVREKIISFYEKVIEEAIGSDTVHAISGTATAAIPNATFIADVLKKPMVYVQVGKKETEPSEIFGAMPKKGQSALTVEDHVSTGGSLVANVLALREQGIQADTSVVTTTYNMDKAEELFKKHKLTVYTLTDIDTILDEAVTAGYLKAKEKAIVVDWVADPPGWAKRQGLA